MKPIRLSIDIDALPELVFWTAEDVTVRRDWDHRVARLAAHEPPADRVMHQYWYRYLPGIIFRHEVHFIVFDPPRRSSIRTHCRNACSLLKSGVGAWTFEPQSGGTHFETSFTYECRWGWIGRLLDSIVLKPTVTTATRRALRRLKQVCERRQREGWQPPVHQPVAIHSSRAG